MKVQENEVSIYHVTYNILKKLSSTYDHPTGKATLAKLRNSLGRSVRGNSEVWPVLFENLPQTYLGTNSSFTAYEQAILTTLQLYSLHQQGLSTSILNLEDSYMNMGKSLKVLRTEDSKKSIDHRFNTLVTSATYEELIHHLRQLIKLLRSREKETGKVNYAKLSQDLFWYLKGYDENIKLNWSREYYRTNFKGEDQNYEE
ncbi:type I-E CRISPR-associated protein Cse2/CasB [Falseniella ignava]|uniref:Type I-E CRISPR-associated protein Cse2/CasB n=1 Tax=Falseniella ignava TaxID=137730 RepID=A0A2I1JYT4_9LACT|nr:type I-E CRISPR-associated protein Cse2/CasB [Falseniella ignava]PKY88566.1 type I-E CRISPR-associated protein Cse2/CasB [Falseniella ignava]